MALNVPTALRRPCAALAVAAQQQPPGTLAASALAAAAGRAFLRISEDAPSRQSRARSASEHTFADALAVAAHQQPRGTPAATAMAAAAGRAFLRASAGSARPRARSACSERVVLSTTGHRQVSCGPASQTSSLPYLCADTSNLIFGALWSVQQPAHGGQQALSSGLSGCTNVSPRTLDTRLRVSKHLFGDLSRVSAVSPTWCQRVDRDGWSSTHAYLFQEAGSKVQLQERYSHSMRRLAVQDWLGFAQAAPASENLRGNDDVISRIVTFLP